MYDLFLSLSSMDSAGSFRCEDQKGDGLWAPFFYSEHRFVVGFEEFRGVSRAGQDAGLAGCLALGLLFLYPISEILVSIT